MINGLFPNLFNFQVCHARHWFGNQITMSSWKAWQHWLTSSFIKSFFVQLNWTVLIWPVVFSRHLWKTRLWTVGSCAVASFGDIPRHFQKKSAPTSCRWEAARRRFFARAQKSFHGFATFQRQITKFGLPQKLYHALLETWNFNTKSQSLDCCLTTQEQEHATVSLTYKTEFTSNILWNSDQSFWSTSDLKFAFPNHSLLPFLESRCCCKYFFVSNILNFHYLCFKMSCHWEKSTKI